MSGTKRVEANLVGEAATAFMDAVSERYQQIVDHAEVERQRRQTKRLHREQAEIRLTFVRLNNLLQELRSSADADKIRPAIENLQDRLGACTLIQAVNLPSTSKMLRTLSSIEHALIASRRRIEAIRLSRSLEGAASTVERIKRETDMMNRSDSERFDAGKLASIIEFIRALERDIHAKRLDQVESGIAILRQQLDAHLQRVQAGLDEYERVRKDSQYAISGITDRFDALSADAGFVQYVKADLDSLQPGLQVLPRLQAAGQFANVHLQVTRLNARIDLIVTAARSRIEQIEKQKSITARLISTIMSARGTLLAGYPEQGQGNRAVLRFRIMGRGVLHIEVGIDEAVIVRAEGFKHKKHVRTDGTVEKSCDDFISWFEGMRSVAVAQGLDLGPLHWDGEPPSGRTGVTAKRTSYVRNIHQAGARRTHP